jgi:hypothetical protein
LGVFLGGDLNVHRESEYILRLNRHLLTWLGAHWDSPLKADSNLRRNPHLCSLLSSWLLRQLEHPAVRRYWRGFQGDGEDKAWGWKEPRTCATVEIWANLFGSLKTIHLTRNGLHVADSLQSREARRLEKWCSRGGLPNAPNLHFSPRCLVWRQALDVWAEYEQLCLNWRSTQKEESVCHVKYEDLISRPNEVLAIIARFLNLSSDSVDHAASVLQAPDHRGTCLKEVPAGSIGTTAWGLLKFHGYSQLNDDTSRSTP